MKTGLIIILLLKTGSLGQDFLHIKTDSVVQMFRRVFAGKNIKQCGPGDRCLSGGAGG